MSKRYSGRTSQMIRIWRNLAAVRQGWRCHWCGIVMVTGRAAAACENRQLTADHVIPRHSGGQDERENIVAACKSCNNKRTPRRLSAREKWALDYRSVRIERRLSREHTPQPEPPKSYGALLEKPPFNNPFSILAKLLGP